jgi:Tfp pilus assembly protein PilE
MAFFPDMTRRKRRSLRGDDACAPVEVGFTIVEALVALLLTSLVLGLAYGSYTFLSRMTTQWRGRMALENTAHLLVRDLTRRAHRAVEIKMEDDSWRFVSPEGTPTRYRHRGTSLYRNGRPTHEARVDLVAVSLDLRKPNDSGPGEQAPAGRKTDGPEGEREGGRRRHLRLRLTAATRSDTLILRTAVYLRQPAAWPSADPSGYGRSSAAPTR